eukprot:GFUD01044343.1.p1 GENE.GFUD01044343.1~~GFUD01044343.1.p1  ORF type:complete len:409 (+),score=131.11 GFUD01044343.1:61-1227(+)
MGEISLKCKNRRKIIEIVHRKFSDGKDKEVPKKQGDCGDVKEDLEDLIEDRIVSEILAEVSIFDNLLKEPLQAFETSESESDDFEDLGSELLNLLSDVSTENVCDEQKTLNNSVSSEIAQTDLVNEDLHLFGDSTQVEVEESGVRWRKTTDLATFEKIIDDKIDKVKQPPSNLVTILNLESGETSSVRLKEQMVTDFQHEVDKDTFDKRLDTRSEETKLKKETEVSGRDLRAPYRKSKRGSLGICYKLEMEEFDEVHQSKAESSKQGLKNQSSSSTDPDQADVDISKRRRRKRFRHYKEFITPKGKVYDESVLSKLLSIPSRKKYNIVDGDTSCEESLEDIDSLSSDISSSDSEESPRDDPPIISETFTSNQEPAIATAAIGSEENDK